LELTRNVPDPARRSLTVATSSSYLGSGYLNPEDVLLAAGVEASIRTDREALMELRRRPPACPADRAW
jgi:hypothetical protein